MTLLGRRSLAGISCTLLAFLCFMAAACFSGDSLTETSSSKPPPPLVTISISPVTATVAAGGRQLFKATVTGTTTTGLRWSSSGGDMDRGLSPSSAYWFAPVAAGTYTITATALPSSKSATATATVTPIN